MHIKMAYMIYIMLKLLIIYYVIILITLIINKNTLYNIQYVYCIFY